MLSNAFKQITNRICFIANWLFCSLDISDFICQMAMKLIVFFTLCRAILKIISDWRINQCHFSKKYDFWKDLFIYQIIVTMNIIIATMNVIIAFTISLTMQNQVALGIKKFSNYVLFSANQYISWFYGRNKLH